jgi:hypothetical protein
VLRATDQGFKSSHIAPEDDEPKFGAAAMAPIVHAERACALIAMGESKMLLESDKGDCIDITRFGNEIQDNVAGMLVAVAEDLNADGTIDLYAATAARGSPSFYCMNRGYGSFMLSEKYNAGKVIPPEVYNQPARGLAAGDATGDGANDLLVAGADGTLWLLVNETLTDRKAQAEVSTPSDERKQIQARIVTVRITRRTGVVGCRLALSDDQGRLIACRQIGGNVGVGCCGPHQVSFAVREPGRYKLDVRFADGTRTSLPVNLSADQPRHQVVVVPAGPGL